LHKAHAATQKFSCLQKEPKQSRKHLRRVLESYQALTFLQNIQNASYIYFGRVWGVIDKNSAVSRVGQNTPGAAWKNSQEPTGPGTDPNIHKTAQVGP